MGWWAYPVAPRTEVVALGRAGQPVAELARRFGVPPRTIGYWLAHPDPAGPGRPGVDVTTPT